MRYCPRLSLMAMLAVATPAQPESRDAFARMWHQMAQTEYGEMHGEAYAAALAECVLAVFAGLEAGDRDLLAEYAMNPPEPDASRIDTLLPGHAAQMLACGETVRPEDFDN